MSTESPSPPPNPDKFDKTNKKKPEFRSFRIDSKKTTTNYDAVFEYLKNNTKDCIAYILMIVGILLMLFNTYEIYGSLIIGVIFSLYFASELAFATTNIKDFIEEYGTLKSLVIAGTLLALFIKVPFLFIGIAFVTLIRVLVWPEPKV